MDDRGKGSEVSGEPATGAASQKQKSGRTTEEEGMTSSRSHRKGHRPRRRRPAIELAPVSLQLKSHVFPAWECAEPDAYIVDLNGDILLAGDDEDDTRIGTISAYSVHLDQALEDGVSWFEVLDAPTSDMAMYIDLISPNESAYTDWVQSNLEPLGSKLLIIDRVRIEPEHRGHGYGLCAAQLMIQGFTSDDGLVACVPAPYELLEDAPCVTPEDDQSPKQIPGWTAAEAKLRQYWSLLGFRQVPESDVFALSLTHQQPSMREIIQAYFTLKRGSGPLGKGRRKG
jgi:hypothetical protein